jgi:hypothetical protein
MKVFNLNFKFKDLKGSELDVAPANQVVANHLSEYIPDAQEEDLILKYYGWVKSLQSGESITLDNSDLQKFKNIVRDKLSLTNIAKAQIFEALEKNLKDTLKEDK